MFMTLPFTHYSHDTIMYGDIVRNEGYLFEEQLF